ncbi:hypothetical protein QZH41_010253, partial [Actinostola sp. cb2023]
MASSNEVEDEDDCTVLSLNLGIQKENLTQIAEASEDGSLLLKKVRECLHHQTQNETKWRTEMTALRRARVNAEQQFAQIEKQLITCNSKLDAEVKRNVNITEELQQSGTSVSETKKKLQELEALKEDALANYSKVAKVNEQLETEKLELLAVLDRKSHEIQGLNEEWKNMSEKLSNANAAKFKVEGKLDEIESQGTSFVFRERRLKQETELLKQQNDWLNAELKKKTEELSYLRKSKSSQILELQSSLDEKNQESITSIEYYSIEYYSIEYYSIEYYSIEYYSIEYYSIEYYSIEYYSIEYYSIEYYKYRVLQYRVLQYRVLQSINYSIEYYSIEYYSIEYYSIEYYSIEYYSIEYYSIEYYSIEYYSIEYYSIEYYSIEYYSIEYYSIEYYSIEYYSIEYYSIEYYSIEYYSIEYYSIEYYSIEYYSIEYYKYRLSHLKQSSEESKKRQSELEANVESYMEKLKEVRYQLVKSEENYKMELASQSKLAQLYKDEAEVKKKEAKEMLTAMEELQKLLKTCEDARIDLQSKVKENEEYSSKTVTDLETKISNLENELNNVNDLLQAARQRGLAPMTPQSLAEMSPVAAATSSLLKSGMTLTEELEEKAPILQQQRKDYEQALRSNDKLTMKLETAIVEHDRAVIAAEESIKQSDHLKRENSRLKSLSADLSHQVQILLKECEETRAGKDKMTVSFSEEVTSSSQVISERLVSFRSIEELQQQNQRLLAVIRELSEDKEKQEAEGSEDILKGLKEQLDVALKEVEHVKIERSKQMEMVELMVRQRDMYRVLLANTGQSAVSILALIARIPFRYCKLYMYMKEHVEISICAKLDDNNQSSSAPDKSLVAVEQTRDALRELQKHFADYKDDRKLAEDKLNGRLESVGMENAKLCGETSKLKSQVEFSGERYKMLQSNLEGFKKETAAANEKAHHLNLSNVKLQAFVDSQSQELAALKDKLNKAEVIYENLTAVKEMLRDSEVRLLQENKSLLEQQKGCHVLVTNLQKMQNQLERNQFDTRTRLEAQIEGLQKEVTLAKRKVESEESHGRNIIRKQENQLQELRIQIDTTSKDHRITKDNLVSNIRQMEVLENKYAETKAQCEAAERRLNEVYKEQQVMNGEDMGKAKKELVAKYEMMLQESSQNLKESASRAKGLEDQLMKSKMQEEQFKSMSLAHEEALKTLNVTTDEIKSNLQARLNKAEDENSYFQGQIQGLESRNTALLLENNTVEKENGRQISELQEILSTIRNELEEARMKSRSASAGEQMAREELNEQVQIATQCQEKYERELMLHANDIKALTLAKDKVVVQMASSAKSFASSEVPIEGGAKSMVEVWEIVRFVRREKEISDTRAEMALTESLRYQQRCTFLEKKLDESQTNLQEEKTQVQVDVETAAKHAEVLEKVQNLNELTQANKVLMDDKQSLEQRTKALEGKVKKGEGEIQTLKESNRSLTTSKDSLLGEKSALKNEIMRWTTKTNNLLEQYKNINVEEYKRMTEEKKLFQQQIATLKAENQRTKIQLETLKTNAASTTDELATLKKKHTSITEEHEAFKTGCTKLQSEIDASKKSLAEKTEEIKEKITTLNKVKRIARQYKSQHDDLKKKQEEQAAATAVVESKAEGSSEDVSTYENQIKQLTLQVQTLEEKVKTLKDSDEQNKVVYTEQLFKWAQIKEKEDKSKKVLIQAREKIQQLTAAKDRLGAEKEELRKAAKTSSETLDKITQEKKELEIRLQALQSQYDGRVAKLEKELNDCKANKNSEAEESLKKLEEKHGATADQPTTSTKRQREDENDRTNQTQGSEPLVKKIRTTEVVASTEEEVEDEGEEERWEVPDTPEIVLIDSGDESDREVDEEMDEEEEEEEDEYEDHDDGDQGRIDVVEVIDDDDDDDDVNDNEGDGYDEEKEMEEEEIEDLPESQSKEEQDEEGTCSYCDVVGDVDEGDEEEDNTGEEVSIAEDEQQGDQDVIAEEVQVSNDEEVQVAQTQSVSDSHELPSVAATLQQQEEPAPVGRSVDRPPRSHLAPFSFPPGQSSQVPFDEADDCTVPSTPTLFVPKRTDGFAEAISSPHIHRPFNFAPPTEGSSGMQVLGLESSISEGGMRVDDTHVNLMDETSEETASCRTSFTDGATGNKQPDNQSVPEQTQSGSSESASRQQSLESLESEDFSTSIITDVPSITVTPANERTADESAEQNVPDTQQESDVESVRPGDEGGSADKE